MNRTWTETDSQPYRWSWLEEPVSQPSEDSSSLDDDETGVVDPLLCA